MDKSTLEAKRAELQKDLQTIIDDINEKTAQMHRFEGAILLINEQILKLEPQEVKTVEGETNG